MNEQGSIDERIAELHRLIEQRLERDPVGTMRVAKENLTRLQALLGDRPTLKEWARALATRTDEVRSILLGSSDRAVWLRSSSPW